ncbi:hypothetical protein RRG08_011609 [Elysia crispata]|uniref:Uncharacterized protein n=1 Tax=Elysia crispata TaxID=231223 RepID=A0AAE0XP17_9GAST|nr:hypothetical protein RRG08_011609 [Elysia crispata]
MCHWALYAVHVQHPSGPAGGMRPVSAPPHPTEHAVRYMLSIRTIESCAARWAVLINYPHHLCDPGCLETRILHRDDLFPCVAQLSLLVPLVRSVSVTPHRLVFAFNCCLFVLGQAFSSITLSNQLRLRDTKRLVSLGLSVLPGAGTPQHVSRPWGDTARSSLHDKRDAIGGQGAMLLTAPSPCDLDSADREDN